MSGENCLIGEPRVIRILDVHIWARIEGHTNASL